MRTLVVGDIHGKLDLFNLLLGKMEYRAGEDRLILIGDLVDRGENSRGVVARAIELKREAPNNVIVLRGNHEAMMLAALSHPESEQAELWYYNGGVETIQSYMDEEGGCDVPEEHWDFLASLPTWYEDDHAIYVHASLPESFDGTFLHPGEVSESPELYWARNRRFFAEYQGKTVVFGHTITGMVFGERGEVWLRDSLIGVDTGAYLTGVLSAIELPSRRVFRVADETQEDEENNEGGRRGVGIFSRIVSASNRIRMGKLNAYVCSSRLQTLEEAAAAVAGEIRRLISARGRAIGLFAAARSQIEFFDYLVNAEGIEWTKVIGFHLDEYLGADEESPHSQRRFLIDRLVKRVPMAEFHGLRGEAANPEAVCANYAALLKSRPPDFAALDLCENGRLAPIHPRLCDSNDPLMVRSVEGVEESRGAISLTIPAIMACPKLFLIATDTESMRRTIKDEGATDFLASIMRTHEDAHIWINLEGDLDAHAIGDTTFIGLLRKLT